MFDSLKICGWHSTLLVIDYDNVLKISSCVCVWAVVLCVCVHVNIFMYLGINAYVKRFMCARCLCALINDMPNSKGGCQ